MRNKSVSFMTPYLDNVRVLRVQFFIFPTAQTHDRHLGLSGLRGFILDSKDLARGWKNLASLVFPASIYLVIAQRTPAGCPQYTLLR